LKTRKSKRLLIKSNWFEKFTNMLVVAALGWVENFHFILLWFGFWFHFIFIWISTDFTFSFNSFKIKYINKFEK